MLFDLCTQIDRQEIKNTIVELLPGFPAFYMVSTEMNQWLQIRNGVDPAWSLVGSAQFQLLSHNRIPHEELFIPVCCTDHQSSSVYGCHFVTT
jgi:hypothetical protein